MYVVGVECVAHTADGRHRGGNCGSGRSGRHRTTGRAGELPEHMEGAPEAYFGAMRSPYPADRELP
jgi:hypothetical protein